MANVSIQPTAHSFGHNIINALIAPFTAFGGFLIKISESNSRVQLIERMNNLTDIELAEKYGINRDQIVGYVFRDKMYL